MNGILSIGYALAVITAPAASFAAPIVETIEKIRRRYFVQKKPIKAI
jgi:hypothetical protein